MKKWGGALVIDHDYLKCMNEVVFHCHPSSDCRI